MIRIRLAFPYLFLAVLVLASLPAQNSRPSAVVEFSSEALALSSRVSHFQNMLLRSPFLGSLLRPFLPYNYIQFDERTALAHDPVLGNIFCLGEIPASERLGAIEILAEGLSSIESVAFGSTAKSVEIWTKRLSDPKKSLDIYVLISPRGELRGFAKVSERPEWRTVVLAPLAVSPGGPRGQGTFILKTLLRRWSDIGVVEAQWTSTTRAVEFYAGALADWVDYQYNPLNRQVVVYPKTFGTLTPEEQETQRGYRKRLGREREVLQRRLSRLIPGAYAVQDVNGPVAHWHLQDSRKWIESFDDRQQEQSVETLACKLTFSPYLQFVNADGEVVELYRNKISTKPRVRRDIQTVAVLEAQQDMDVKIESLGEALTEQNRERKKFGFPKVAFRILPVGTVWKISPSGILLIDLHGVLDTEHLDRIWHEGMSQLHHVLPARLVRFLTLEQNALSGTFLKPVGIDNEVPVSAEMRLRWIHAALEENIRTVTIKDQTISAIFVTDPLLPKGMEGTYLRFTDEPLIIITRRSLETGDLGAEQAVYYAYVASLWSTAALPLDEQPFAHIYAVAQTVFAFGPEFLESHPLVKDLHLWSALRYERRIGHFQFIKSRLGRQVSKAIHHYEQNFLHFSERAIARESLPQDYASLRKSQQSADRDHPYYLTHGPTQLLEIMRHVLDQTYSLDQEEDLLKKLHAEVWPIYRGNKGLALETLDDAMALSILHIDAGYWMSFDDPYEFGNQRFLNRARRLAQLSPRAAALLFATLGPHIRSDFNPAADITDRSAGGAALHGFLPQLKYWVDHRAELNAEEEEELQGYIGALFNGMFSPTLENNHFDEEWLDIISSYGLSLESLIHMSTRMSPNEEPLYLLNAGDLTGRDLYEDLRRYNERTGSDITLWQVLTGHVYAEPYLAAHLDKQAGRFSEGVARQLIARPYSELWKNNPALTHQQIHSKELLYGSL